MKEKTNYSALAPVWAHPLLIEIAIPTRRCRSAARSARFLTVGHARRSARQRLALDRSALSVHAYHSGSGVFCRFSFFALLRSFERSRPPHTSNTRAFGRARCESANDALTNTKLFRNHTLTPGEGERERKHISPHKLHAVGLSKCEGTQ